MSEWTIAEPQKLTFDGAVSNLNVRTVGGTVNVVGTDEGSARLEVGEIEGPPLVVTRKGSTLTITYEDLPWKGLLGWLDRRGWRRRAVVSVAVPTATRVELGVVSANAVVSGISERIAVQGVSGDTTLVRVAGPVRANTVSGSLEAQDVSGELRFSTVSGELTVVEGTGGRVKADSVSGGMVLDLDPRSGTDVHLSTVSGEVAIRLPAPCDAKVDANTTSGDVSTAFDELRLSNQWGAKRLTGTLGSGTGKLRVTTVTGSVALLRRPPGEDGTAGAAGKEL
jgi:Putative adhesin